MSNIKDDHKKFPYVQILEQPSSRGVRFRYECEREFAGAVVGETSCRSKRTFPTIQIVNYKGPAFVVVSCVTKNPPYRPHPHNLVGKSKVSNGICYFKITSDLMTVRLTGLGIQCVKRKEIRKSLKNREMLKVDPFNTGFSHADVPDSIDLYCLRLCFQVFIEGPEKGILNVPLDPVVSEQIHDRRMRIEPTITFISHLSASVDGGTEMCILCEKAVKDDIQVRFYREEDNWEAIAEFTPPNVYRKVSIVFLSPRYTKQDITEPVRAFVQLRRISDGEASEPISFQFLPVDTSKVEASKRKRKSIAAIAEKLKAVAIKNKELANAARATVSDDSQAWELPAKSKTPAGLSQIPEMIVPHKRNNLNASRGRGSKRPIEPVIEVEQNASNASSAQLNEFEKQPVHKTGLNTSQNFASTGQQSHQSQQSTDTLNSDSWIKDVLGSMNQDESLKDLANHISRIAYEPETEYILPDVEIPDSPERLNTGNHLQLGPDPTIESFPPANVTVYNGISNFIKHRSKTDALVPNMNGITPTQVHVRNPTDTERKQQMTRAIAAKQNGFFSPNGNLTDPFQPTSFYGSPNNNVQMFSNGQPLQFTHGKNIANNYYNNQEAQWNQNQHVINVTQNAESWQTADLCENFTVTNL